jgi:hypothetical protein
MNRSVTLQFWIIAALVPMALMLTGGVGEYDFAAFWLAGKQALAGADPYSAASTKIFADRFTNGTNLIFLYPPHALFLFIPFALVPYISGYLLWDAATAGFFYWAARPYCPKGFPRVLAVLTPAALTCVDFGQTGLVFGALWLLAFRGKWAAVALLTFKPQLGLLSILSLKDWRSLAYTFLLAAALIAASMAIFGPSAWVEFARNSIGHTDQFGHQKRWLFAGVSPAIGYGLIGWIPFAVAGGLLLARRVNAFTAATAAMLISPYGFHYDMPVACLGFGLLIYDRWSDMPIRHRLPIALGFLSPVIAIAGAWWAPPVLLWALWGQVSVQTEPLLPSAEPTPKHQRAG